MERLRLQSDLNVSMGVTSRKVGRVNKKKPKVVVVVMMVAVVVLVVVVVAIAVALAAAVTVALNMIRLSKCQMTITARNERGSRGSRDPPLPLLPTAQRSIIFICICYERASLLTWSAKF